MSGRFAFLKSRFEIHWIAGIPVIGGSDGEFPGSIAVDAVGNAYVTGETYSLDFPTSNPAQPNPDASSDTTDIFVAKINPQGSALVYSTYLCGRGFDAGFGITVDEDGNAYL